MWWHLLHLYSQLCCPSEQLSDMSVGSGAGDGLKAPCFSGDSLRLVLEVCFGCSELDLGWWGKIFIKRVTQPLSHENHTTPQGQESASALSHSHHVASHSHHVASHKSSRASHSHHVVSHTVIMWSPTSHHVAFYGWLFAAEGVLHGHSWGHFYLSS